MKTRIFLTILVTVICYFFAGCDFAREQDKPERVILGDVQSDNNEGNINVTMSPTRTYVDFDFDWRFSRGDFPDAVATGFDDSNWRKVNLPHDWSIEGPYDQNAPTGGAGGYLPTGVGWYRKRFTLPEAASDRIVWIEFDGIYENSTIWMNGEYLGERPFGYISFHYDLTPYLVDGENVIAVRVDNSNQPNTRWYSGSGIYRHVRLIVTGLIHVGHWGVYITTPEASTDSATVSVRTLVKNEDSDPAEAGEVRSILIDPNGREIASIGNSFLIEPGQQTELKQRIRIASPSLWSVETPVLYTIRTVVFNNGIPTDGVITPVGIRKIEYDVDRGFVLNGKQVKMKGVNLHHDGGCVGSAVPEGVWKRRLRMLKAMGCNAIRTAHNPPAPEFLDICDRMGFLVMDEAFDEWKIAKSQAPNMYHLYFDEWYEEDLKAMIHRDRNHPCIVMWSAGNEVREQPREDGHEVLQSLIEIFHREDSTRPVTVGCDNIAADDGSARLPFLNLLDIVGYNYVDRWHERRELYYSLDRHEHPDWKMVGTESVSIYGVRGGYSLGRDPDTVRPNYNTRMIRAEQLWKFVATRDYVIGDFMWTGIDYLGESRWPWKSSSSGVLDLCGFPKDSYYFYQSQWTDEPMIHIFPHWNWPDRQGRVIPVLCYTNCDAVELFLNGKSFGEKRLEFPRQGNSGSWYRYEKLPINPTTADLHLAWDVPYEPGVLKAVGKRNGQVVCTQQVRTAGAPAAIRLRADRKSIIADARDVAHVEVEIVDSKGVFVSTADNLVHFTVEGQGHLIAVGNGNPADHDSFQADRRRAFNGLCLAIVQSVRQPGRIRLTASADGLKEASVEIEALPVTSQQSESVQTKRVVFEDSASEHKWALKELNPDLPRDWSTYDYLVMELRASSTQRFELHIHTTDGIRKVRIHPFQGAWIRASVPLKYFKRPESEGFDLASLGNKPRNTFWINLLGSYGPLNEVKALGVAMTEPIGEPTLEIRSVRLAKEDPGDAVLQAGPLVDEFGQWAGADWPGKVKTLNELKQKWQQEQENLQPGDFNYCKYGGYLHTQAKATGFFRVEQIDGKWWFIDPDGHQFLSIGADCVGAWMGTQTTGREDIFVTLPPTELTRSARRGGRFPYASFYTWNLQRRYGEDWDHKWIDTAIRRMDAWGLNTIANWSDPRLLGIKRKPYVATLGGWGMRTGYMGLPDVYLEEFAQRADEVAARQCGPRKDDPWLLGYFVANEPPWPGRESLVVDMILQGEPTVTQQKLKEFLAAGDTPERRKAFVHRAFEKCLEIINAAIRKHDPNHLNLGIRYGGAPPEEVIRMARVFDVYSQNVYKYVPEPQYLDKLYQLTGRPIIIGEFHFGTPGRGLAPGLRQTKNQQERSIAYRYYVENAIAHPAVIGTHWFQWVDQPATGRMDGENYNIGLIDVTDQPYPELVEALRATHERLYDVHSVKVLPVNEKPKVR